jgi:hypothetical protein
MAASNIRYPEQAQELAHLLEEDQIEWREYARKEFEMQDKANLKPDKQILRQHVQKRAERMLEILTKIEEPSISNIGTEGALAISVLATHTSLEVTHDVLRAFNDLYTRNKEDTRYQSIPAMTDWLAILEHRPQTFGTIWLMDEAGYPFLPTVEDFEHVNGRRTEYGVGPLRWPKSLAISEAKQPWLNKPLSGLVMRDPTDEEYAAFEHDY